MLNSVILMGRLTADPELRQTQNGTSVEVIADEVSFCGSKADKPQTPNNDDFEEIPISDDLPF